MFRSVRGLWIAVLATAVANGWGIRLSAQEPAANSTPVVHTTLPFPNGFYGDVPACAPYEDCNGPLLRMNPMLPEMGGLLMGWVAAIDAGIFKPHLKNEITDTLTLSNGTPNTLTLPSAALHWTGMPHVEIGYCFSQDFGELLVGYRSLVSEGNTTLPVFGVGTGALHSRLDANVVDIDYGSNEICVDPASPWPWDMKWRVGARLAGIFFDSRATNALLDEHISNNFFGAGPHASLDLRRALNVGGLFVFGKLEGAAVLGHVHQAFEEVSTIGGPAAGTDDVRSTQAVMILNTQAGVGWKPDKDMPLQLSVGYQFEYWGYVGSTSASAADLTVQGIFFRGEWNY